MSVFKSGYAMTCQDHAKAMDSDMLDGIASA
jgi:hypothetical protein